MYLIFGLGFAAFLFSLVLTPLVRDCFRKLGIVDHPDGIRKRHASPIPRVGGIAIALSYMLAFAFVFLLPFSYNSEVAKALPGIWRLFFAAGLIFATGLFDDLVGYFPWQKLAGQLWAAMIAWFAGVRIEIFPDHPLNLLWNIPLTIIWLVGCTNAFNLIDGLDGLAAGVGLFATATMLLAAFANQNLQLVLVTMPLAGALIGFLRYNFNPASIFLGDCGSLLIGFLLGCYGVLWSEKSATLLGMTAPLLALAIPLLDVGLSIVRRFLRHQPLFGGDRGHVHHMLLARGLTARRVALVLYGVCGIGAALSLLMNALQNQFAGIIVVLFCVSAWIGIQHLGYIEFATARQLISKGTFRRIIDSQTRLKQFEQTLAQTQSIEQCWQAIQEAGRDFGFCSVRLVAANRVFDSVFDPGNPGPFLQIRITLPDSQYVNFTRGTKDDQFSLVAVGGFAQTVSAGLASKLAQLSAEIVSKKDTTIADGGKVRSAAAVAG
jgi:UDP-GlcNAc:undecaprenyl-phosphate GlcNAc-1-phosphate transferase